MSTKFENRYVNKLWEMKATNDVLYLELFQDITESDMTVLDNILTWNSSTENQDWVTKLCIFDFINQENERFRFLRRRIWYGLPRFILQTITSYPTVTKSLKDVSSATACGFFLSMTLVKCLMFLLDIEWNLWPHQVYTALCSGVLGYCFGTLESVYRMLKQTAGTKRDLQDAGSALRYLLATKDNKTFMLEESSYKVPNTISQITNKFCKDKDLCERFLKVYSEADTLLQKDIQLHFNDIQNTLTHNLPDDYSLDYSPIEKSLPIYMEQIVDKHYTQLRDAEQMNIDVVAQCLNNETS